MPWAWIIKGILLKKLDIYSLILLKKVHILHKAQPGHSGLDIVYCDQGGVLTCCFSAVKCEKNFHAINDKVTC